MDNKAFGDDLSIVRGCIDGDLSAWARLVKKYSCLIEAAAKRRLLAYSIKLPCQDIEDIKQEALSSIWKGRKLEVVRNRDNISYWIAVVSGNIAMDYARKRKPAMAMEGPGSFEDMDRAGLAEFVPSPAADPAQALSRDEIIKRIERSVESLPDKEKLILKLNIFYDKKYREISDMLNIPNGTVSSYIRRAKERLKESLKDLSR